MSYLQGINWSIEKSFQLRGVRVYDHDLVSSSFSKQVADQLRCNGDPLVAVLLIAFAVEEVWGDYVDAVHRGKPREMVVGEAKQVSAQVYVYSYLNELTSKSSSMRSSFGLCPPPV